MPSWYSAAMAVTDIGRKSSSSAERGQSQEIAGDIDGQVVQAALPAQGGIQQQARLDRAAAAELDNRDLVAGGGDDLVGIALEDGALGAGQVVFGQVADPLEQLRADPVVKKAAGEPLSLRLPSPSATTAQNGRA